jgi:hypothetical protein
MEWVRLSLMVIGTGSTSYGAWLVTPAAGFIVAGVALFAVGLIGSVRS